MGPMIMSFMGKYWGLSQRYHMLIFLRPVSWYIAVISLAAITLHWSDLKAATSGSALTMIEWHPYQRRRSLKKTMAMNLSVMPKTFMDLRRRPSWTAQLASTVFAWWRSLQMPTCWCISERASWVRFWALWARAIFLYIWSVVWMMKRPLLKSASKTDKTCIWTSRWLLWQTSPSKTTKASIWLCLMIATWKCRPMCKCLRRPRLKKSVLSSSSWSTTTSWSLSDSDYGLFYTVKTRLCVWIRFCHRLMKDKVSARDGREGDIQW